MVKLNVPYLKQEKMYTCLVASVRMILKRLKHNVSEEKLAQIAKASIKTGADYYALKSYMENKGFQVNAGQVKNRLYACRKIKQLLEKGFPVICVINRMVYDQRVQKVKTKVVWQGKWKGTSFSLHAIIVTGIDKRKVYINDSLNGRISLNHTDFIKSWFDKKDPGYFCTISK